jgi:outer membrane protein OmpA-like peptidoglycan-associated protein
MRMRLTAVLPVVLVVFAQAAANGQSAAVTYADSRGRKVTFPLGDASFADEIVDATPGKPAPRDARWSDSSLALGPPNYVNRNAELKAPSGVTLGCGGAVTFRFADNALVDVPGPDLYVFEVGPAIEATTLSISSDGQAWTVVGAIRGGTAEVDIAKVAVPGASYRYVRLVDLKAACGGPWPGADVDAVGAIGSTLALSFDASVLFDVDMSVLKPQARTALTQAVERLAQYPAAAITVEGHTDSTGAPAYNVALSQRRAESVRAFLVQQPSLKGRTIAARGYGDARPAALNDSDANRQRNRRVEIVVDLRP